MKWLTVCAYDEHENLVNVMMCYWLVWTSGYDKIPWMPVMGLPWMPVMGVLLKSLNAGDGPRPECRWWVVLNAWYWWWTRVGRGRLRHGFLCVAYRLDRCMLGHASCALHYVCCGWSTGMGRCDVYCFPYYMPCCYYPFTWLLEFVL